MIAKQNDLSRRAAKTALFIWCQKGMTIIEILIALAIMGGLMGTFVVSMGSNSENVRAESGQILAAIRHCYFQAAMNNRYYRIAFDLSAGQYKIESSNSPFYVVKDGDERAEELQRNLEKMRDEEIDETGLEGQFDEESSESDFPTQHTFDSGVKLNGVYVQHQTERITDGTAYLYFFPKGLTEFAVIHLSDEDDQNFISLIVNPLTAQVEVETDYVDPEEVLAAFKNQ